MNYRAPLSVFGRVSAWKSIRLISEELSPTSKWVWEIQLFLVKQVNERCLYSTPIPCQFSSYHVIREIWKFQRKPIHNIHLHQPLFIFHMLQTPAFVQDQNYHRKKKRGPYKSTKARDNQLLFEQAILQKMTTLSQHSNNNNASPLLDQSSTAQYQRIPLVAPRPSGVTVVDTTGDKPSCKYYYSIGLFKFLL